MTAVEVAQTQGIDRAAVLRELKINPNDPRAQTHILMCQRYGLDPLMKHAVVIDGKLYVTRDGYLHIAHVSEQLDGIEVVDEGEDDTHWWAKVAVYRKDMGRPFAYRGRYPKQGGNSKYGPEMAVKTAEVMALRRAFDVAGAGALEERWDEPEAAVAEPDPDQWFRDNGWKDQAHHDEGRAATFAVLKTLNPPHKTQAHDEYKQRGLGERAWTYAEAEDWAKYLGDLARKAKAESAQAGAGETGDRAAKEPVSQPSLAAESVGPDAPFFRGNS